MESRVVLSKFSMALTFLIIAVLVGGCLYYIDSKSTFYTGVAVLILLVATGLWFAPTKIIIDDKDVTVKSVLSRKRIPIKAICNVEKFQPTMGTIRLFASGGYMGYWGMYRENDIGNYAAYYGKASDCFLIRLYTGDKYVLGCENPDEMIHFLKSKLN